MVEHQRRRPEAGDRVGDAFAGDVERRAVDGFEHRGVAALRIDVAGGRHAEAAGQRGGEVGEDVGVEVGGDHGVDAARLQHHAHGHGVDQFLVPGDVGEVGGNFGGDFVPHHHAEFLRIGFGHHGQMLARPLARAIKGEAHDPLDPDTGENRHLGRHLLRQPTMRPPAMAGIFALGILPHDQPVEIAGPDVPQRRNHPRQHPRRANIGILIKPLADRQAQAPQADMIGNILRPHRPKINRIRLFQGLQRPRRHEHAMLAEIGRAPVIMVHLKFEPAIPARQSIKRLQPGGNHLGANAVSRNGCDAVAAHGSISLIRHGICGPAFGASSPRKSRRQALLF